MISAAQASSRDTDQKKPERWKVALGVSLILVTLPAILMFLLVWWICWLMKGAWLRLRIAITWYPQGRYLLFVYSNSPHWKDYCEHRILSHISSVAVILNWSERAQWQQHRDTLAVQAFQHWTGAHPIRWRGRTRWEGEAFNPAAIIFPPMQWTKTLKFWQAFKDFKHGREKKLQFLETQLFSWISRLPPRRK